MANLGHYSEALKAFDQAIAAHTHANKDSQLAATWSFRAVVLIHLQSYDEALVSCDRALELDPRNVEAWVFRGVALNYLEQYSDSYASYAKAMKLAQPQKNEHWRFSPKDFFSRHFLSREVLGHDPSSSQIPLTTSEWQHQIRSALQRLWKKLKRLRFRH